MIFIVNIKNVFNIFVIVENQISREKKLKKRIGTAIAKKKTKIDEQ